MGATVFRLSQLLLLLSATSDASGPSLSYSLLSSSSLCAARTVNYITHSLPQQCLATNRITNTTSTQDYVVDTTSTTDAASDDYPPAVSPSDQLAASATSALATLEPTTISSTAFTEGSSVPEIISSSIEAVTNEVVQVAETLEEDSALESGNFLSFDEWKKRNLKKAGQSEHIGRRNQVDTQEPRNRPDRVHHSLESLGDDGEIDLDFSGFVPGGPENPTCKVSLPIAETASEQLEDETPSPPAVLARSKDAGTTCKERFNYASFDCAANVLKTNEEAKGPKTVLVENKDSYMLNQCSAQNKFIILELCNDILIDTVVLANFEFFSSTFRTFRVSVSDRYPVKVEKWRTIGTYEARNSREVQAFLVEDPVIWARYLRIEFLSHYGNEFYCPVSLVRIHGTTMMEDYKHDLELAMEDDSEDTEQQILEEEVTFDALTPQAVAEPLKPSTYTGGTPIPTTSVSIRASARQNLAVELKQDEPQISQSATTIVPASLVVMEAIMSVIELTDTCSSAESPTEARISQPTTNQQSSLSIEEPISANPLPSPGTTTMSNSSQNLSPSTDLAAIASVGPDQSKNTTDHLSSASTTKSPIPVSGRSASMSQIVGGVDATTASSADSTKIKSTHSMSDRIRSSSSTLPQPAAPTMQDSFFKSVQKRLQMLETNSSMSLQYIEDQSRALRDAFKKVEQRQLSRTSTFLAQLNYTVLNELREFRRQYDQLWQSTVIELGMQRERYERDNEAINTRIGILADEVIFQRRMAMLQMILILVCLVLVLFSRGAINNYLELPIVQNVLAKSPSSRWLNLSGDSTSRPAQPVRTRSAHQIRANRLAILKEHRRVQSDDSITDTQSGTEVYAPPTSVSEYGQSETELPRGDTKTPTFGSDKDHIKLNGSEFDPSLIRRPATSPPSLRVNGDSPLVEISEASEEELIDTKIEAEAYSFPDGHGSAVTIVERDEVYPTKHLSWKSPES